MSDLPGGRGGTICRAATSTRISGKGASKNKTNSMLKMSMVVGCCAFLLFSASIVGSFVSPTDECCDNCGAMLKYDYAQPGVNAMLVIYRCPDRKCDQRAQREFRDDGTIHWTEW